MIEKLRLFTRAARKATNAATDLQRDLDVVRERLNALRERRTAVERAPLPRAEAEQSLREKIAALGKEFSPWPGNVCKGGDLPAFQFNESFNGRPLHALCAIAPDGVFAAYARALPAEGEGMTPEERASALAEIDAETADTEKVEEAMVRSAERAGLPVVRRADADPAVVLAPDKALPL